MDGILLRPAINCGEKSESKTLLLDWNPLENLSMHIDCSTPMNKCFLTVHWKLLFNLTGLKIYDQVTLKKGFLNSSYLRCKGAVKIILHRISSKHPQKCIWNNWSTCAFKWRQRLQDISMDNKPYAEQPDPSGSALSCFLASSLVISDNV